ncbi:uncharacterized protein [Drosophila takahashii]|uniref:uncharacterized protein isoform X3 n=1 Tax=Drosophila takahashii TaxID=29030 RepID=UPI0038993D2A
MFDDDAYLRSIDDKHKEPPSLNSVNSNCSLSDTSEDPALQEDMPRKEVGFQGWNPTKLKDKKSQKLCVPRKRAAEEDRLSLLKLQQEYYRNENQRAAEKHSCDMERHKLDKGKQLAELRNINLKNALLEMEMEEKEARKKFKFDD